MTPSHRLCIYEGFKLLYSHLGRADYIAVLHLDEVNALGNCNLCRVLHELDELAVSNEPGLAVTLERMCPPDDVAEAGLAEKEEVFVLVDDSHDEPRPVAGAGYSITDGILADMSVLTAPGYRLRGLGSYISSVALEDAMAGGLIPQWRARLDNVGAARTAVGSGFIPAGSRTSVALNA